MKKIIIFSVLICLCGMVGYQIFKTNQRRIDKQYDSASILINKVFEQKEYADSFLPKNYLLMHSYLPSIDSIKESIGLECLRDNNGFSYSVHKFINEEKKTVYCFISYNNEVVKDFWFVSKIPSKLRFKMLMKNINDLDDVKNIDSATFLYDFETPCSFHRFKDGSMVKINYNKDGNKYIISSFEWMEDPSHIVENLLPIDLELIE